MKVPVYIFLLATCFLVGCGDSSSSKTPTSNGSAGGNPLNAPADYVGALGNGKNRAIKTVDIASLTQAIQIFNVNEGHNPKDLQELVDAKLINKIPDAPYGMKIVYDPATGAVRVVNAE